MQERKCQKLDMTESMYETMLKSPSGFILKGMQKDDPTLNLKDFCERCLNSIVTNGPMSTSKFYDISLGFLQNLEKVYLSENGMKIQDYREQLKPIQPGLQVTE
ncbi:MAG: hypothetical protein IBX55_00320 [Methyloprofundus sp.]|nr:hypothetical protein [Methyloprofundus sp.]